MISPYLERHNIALWHRQILLPAHPLAEPSHTNDEQRHWDCQIHNIAHGHLLLARPKHLAQFLHDEHRLVPYEAVVALREGRRADLAVPLPFVALSHDDVGAVESKDLVLLERLGKARACGGDFLRGDYVSIRGARETGRIITLIASGSARRSITEGEGNHRTYIVGLSQYGF